MHAGRGLYHTFSGLSGRLGSLGLSAPASESTTERPEVSLPNALFTVTTDIDRVYVCVLSRSLFTIYRDVIYNEIDRFNFPTELKRLYFSLKLSITVSFTCRVESLLH